MESKLKLRMFVGKILQDVLLLKTTVLQAMYLFPKEFEDKCLEAAFHALVHYEADEDLRKKDPLYAQEQDDYIGIISELLLRGEDLPNNIIAEYQEYYSGTPLYKPDTKENMLEKLKRFINL